MNYYITKRQSTVMESLSPLLQGLAGRHPAARSGAAAGGSRSGGREETSRGGRRGAAGDSEAGPDRPGAPLPRSEARAPARLCRQSAQLVSHVRGRHTDPHRRGLRAEPQKRALVHEAACTGHAGVQAAPE